MSMDLRTISITPLRQTFGHLARRQGIDKPSSRYLEATMDLQPVENFHYRPTWDAQYNIFDARRTQIVMQDWYALKDPRQYFYGAWTLARGKMQENAGADFELVADMNLAAAYPASGQELALSILLPLRHAAWGANLNDAYIGSYSYGIAISQAATYAAMDQLGIAQYITQLAMAFNRLDALSAAKESWLHDAMWQPLRKLVEDMMVVSDWFELFVAQNLALDGVLYPLVYDNFNNMLNAKNGPVVSLLTRFQREWYAENIKWVDAVIKAATTDKQHGADNQKLLSSWYEQWRTRAREAMRPIAECAFGSEATTQLEAVVRQLDARATKSGLTA